MAVHLMPKLKGYRAQLLHTAHYRHVPRVRSPPSKNNPPLPGFDSRGSTFLTTERSPRFHFSSHGHGTVCFFRFR